MNISTRAIFFSLLFVIVSLLVMYLVPEDISWTIHNKFNLDKENNIPSWFSSSLLLSISIVSIVIFLSSAEVIYDYSSSKKNRFWLYFSVFYCFLSLDEGASIHEAFDKAFHVKWIYLYAPFAAMFFLMCCYYTIVLRNKDKNLMDWVLGGLIVFAIGGMGGEFVDYVFYPLSPMFQKMEIVFEEGLEMIGSAMVLVGCLKELGSQRIKSEETHIILQ